MLLFSTSATRSSLPLLAKRFYDHLSPPLQQESLTRHYWCRWLPLRSQSRSPSGRHQDKEKKTGCKHGARRRALSLSLRSFSVSIFSSPLSCFLTITSTKGFSNSGWCRVLHFHVFMCFRFRELVTTQRIWALGGVWVCVWVGGVSVSNYFTTYTYEIPIGVFFRIFWFSFGSLVINLCDFPFFGDM